MKTMLSREDYEKLRGANIVFMKLEEKILGQCNDEYQEYVKACGKVRSVIIGSDIKGSKIKKMGLGECINRDILRPELRQYLDSLQIKRRSQQLHNILLAIMLNKDKDESIIEAVEKSSANSETKKELIEKLNNAGISKK